MKILVRQKKVVENYKRYLFLFIFLKGKLIKVAIKWIAAMIGAM